MKQREAPGQPCGSWGQEPGSGSTAAGCGSSGRHAVPGESLPPHSPALKPSPRRLCLGRNTCRSAATLGNKSERISKRATQEESERGAPSWRRGGPRAPAWALLGCCLCSSLASARGLELNARTWECWGSWLASEEALPAQPAQVWPGAIPARCLSRSSSSVKPRFECTWCSSLPTPNHRAGLL